jgi:TnpA family transposase
MPRRQLLTTAQRDQLLAFPDDESALIRIATLSEADLAFVRQHRGDSNRLGIALQMIYLRYPGRMLVGREKPYPPLLAIIANQLRVAPSAWETYTRDATRSEHLQELFSRLKLELFTTVHARTLGEWLLPTAMQTTQGIVLVQALVGELRRRHIVLPPVTTMENLCASVTTRAQREVHRLLLAPLTAEQKGALDKLLDRRDEHTISTLAWLRKPPGKPSARSILQHIDRLKAIQDLNLPADIGRNVHQNRLLRLAREGIQSAVYQIGEYEPERRHATLLAILIETAATLTDEIINLHDRMIGSFFSRAKHKYEQKFADDGKALNDKVLLYKKIGSVLITAKETGDDPFEAIETVISWEGFVASVQDAERLARGEEFDSLVMIADHFTQLRRYAPAFLDVFEFRAAPVARNLLRGIEVLREMNRTGVRKVPINAPTGFIRKRWKPFVFSGEDIDRKFYEMAVMSELKNALRGGDIWITGSRQFKDFDEYLLPRAEFNLRQTEGRLELPIPVSAEEYLEERLTRLREELDITNKLAAAGELPDVELTEKGLKISPIEDETPEAAGELRYRSSNILPRVKITELLMEVDSWTGFTRHFTHLKTGEEHQDRTLLLTAILADAFNLGLEKMAEACPGTSLAKLAWLVAWHIRDETYSKGLVELVNYQHRLPLAAHWGEGTTSSSDGQRFRAGGHGESAGYQNAKYGDDPGVLFYTHISDQYAPFHTKVINAPVRDATHVLDGLLYHESDLRIEEHYTDTAGFTDHVFALCHLLGFRFAPRIADIADKSLYVPGKASQWPALSPLISATSLRVKFAEQQFPDIIRLAASIKHGSVTASLILRKIGAYPRQNGLAVGLREIGRIERTLFTLKWLQDPALRRRVTAGLNKGEARNALARAVFFHRLGEIRDRSYENQRHRANGLNLVVAAIILWNTVYLERAIAALRRRQPVDDALLAHLSPLGWGHVILTGDYLWRAAKRLAKGEFRPLRREVPTGAPP